LLQQSDGAAHGCEVVAQVAQTPLTLQLFPVQH
jgi:hypothetical protein